MKRFLSFTICLVLVSSCLTVPDNDKKQGSVARQQKMLLEKAQAYYHKQKYDEALQCLEPIKNDSFYKDEVFELYRKIEVDRFKKEIEQSQEWTVFRGIKQVDERLVYPKTYGETITISGEKIDHTLPEGPMEKVLSKKVSMNLQNAGLSAIIMALNKQAGLNIIADSALDQDSQLTVKVENVPLHELLSYMARNMGLDFHIGENMIWVTAGAANTSNAPKLETKIFKLKTGAIPSMADGTDSKAELDDALDAFLDTGPPGAVYRLYRNRNLLIVKNTRDNLKIIEKLIMELDQPIQQVLIEARYITISQEDLKSLGFDLAELTNTTGNQTPVGTFTNNLLRNFPVDGNAVLTGIIGSLEYDLVIHALNEMDSTQTISAPRVTVLNNHTAMIRRGETLRYYEEYELETVVNEAGVAASQPVPVGSVQEIQMGINFEVKPTIGHDGKKIMLNLKPSIVQLEGWDTFITAQLPRTAENELETTAVINSGQTVILGGIITETKQDSDDQIPILGRLPLIGQFFGNQTKDRTPTHLIIFVTVTIMDGSGKYINIQD
jgi:type IV pilus assembly protein PilQ